jgi:hypothetical protein
MEDDMSKASGSRSQWSFLRLTLVGGLALGAIAITHAIQDWSDAFNLQPVAAQDMAGEEAAAPADMPPPAPSYGISDRATFLLSDQLFHSDPEILWPGFLSGLRGYEHFYDPVGNPLYFETPFNNTSFKFLYLWHGFPDGSQIGGGDLSAFALQIRLALTERLGFIATKDGYTVLNAGILPPDEGWNDFAVGLKYVFIENKESDYVMTGGFRWEWANGSEDVLQGDSQELSPFVSVAKGWDRLHFLGNITTRIPMNGNKGNHVLSWDLHLDYEIAPETLPGFAPLVEIHGLHYLSNGDRLPLDVGGYDYTSTGSEGVAGDSVFAMGLGFRWKLTPNASVGSTWAFPLHNPDNDIMGSRVTVDMTLSW